jgi:hypothetical protein
LIVDLIANEHPRALQLGLGLLRPGGVYLASHLESVSNEISTEGDEEQSEHEPLFEPDDFEFARFGDRLNSLIIVRRTERIRTKRRSRTKSR